MILSYIQISLFASSGLMHCLGFLLLCRIKFRPENQRLILMHLSVVEFFHSVTSTIDSILYAQQNIKHTVKIARFTIWSGISFGILFKLILIHLIADRTLDIYLHLKYPVIVTRERIKKLLCILWLLTTITSTTVLVLDKLWIKDTLAVTYVLIKVYMIFDIFVVACSISSFVYLFWKVHSILMKRDSAQSTDQVNARNSIISKLKVPCTMITTYITFNFTAMVLLYMSSPGHYLEKLGTIFYALGITSDSLIYVFLQPNIRSYIHQLWKGCYKNRTQPTNADMATIRI